MRVPYIGPMLKTCELTHMDISKSYRLTSLARAWNRLVGLNRPFTERSEVHMGYYYIGSFPSPVRGTDWSGINPTFHRAQAR